MIGSFAGPYLSSYVRTGALIGFLTPGALMFLIIVANASRKHSIVRNEVDINLPTPKSTVG